MASEKAVNVGRHRRNCAICRHTQREEIERNFIAWRSPIAVAQEYGLADRATVYRHAHAFGLFAKRQCNVRAALEHIIEKAGEVEVNATAAVHAVSVYARINAAGQLVERSERINLNELFERMTFQELARISHEGCAE